jgi:O-acetyl-ADP-ribose deacetylase (regulator of RNase III)
MTSGDRIRLEQGDITRLAVDAIVYAANSSLLGGGGVDGAIHRAAGPGLLAEYKTLGGCPPGEARLTRGYRLPAGHVIHTVGPVWQGGNQGEREILARCYRACLGIARDRGLATIAFPAIATGVYGFPREEAALIAVAEARAHLGAHELPAEIVFVAFDEATLAAYRRALAVPDFNRPACRRARARPVCAAPRRVCARPWCGQSGHGLMRRALLPPRLFSPF